MTRAAAAALLISVLRVAAPPPGDRGHQPRAEGTADRGMLGVLRRDGILVPFAAFNGRDWSEPWPVDLRHRELPINLAAVPAGWWGGKPPEGWRVHFPGGGEREFAVQAPVVYQVYCQKRLGLRTDYRSGELVPPVWAEPHPKDGLAVTRGVDVEPIEIVERSAEWVTLAGTLRPAFDDAEEKTIRALRVSTRWRHPVSQAKRRATPVTLEAWYRSSMDRPGWTVSYVEAVRAYPPGPEDEGCGLETFFRGWLQHTSGDKDRITMAAKVTYCDRVGALYMLPLGRLHLGDRLFWAFQLSGWDQEWYEVAHIAPDRIQFEVDYFAGGRGGC